MCGIAVSSIYIKIFRNKLAVVEVGHVIFYFHVNKHIKVSACLCFLTCSSVFLSLLCLSLCLSPSLSSPFLFFFPPLILPCCIALVGLDLAVLSPLPWVLGLQTKQNPNCVMLWSFLTLGSCFHTVPISCSSVGKACLTLSTTQSVSVEPQQTRLMWDLFS